MSHEVELLSEQLAASYEALSLLHATTARLRAAGGPVELANHALESLVETLPARAVVVCLLSSEQATNSGQSRYLQCGVQAFERDRLFQLIDVLQIRFDSDVAVINVTADDHPDWRFPEIQQLILVPLTAGNQFFGWLAALNHAQGGWFGSEQAYLLQSVGTLLAVRQMMQDVEQMRREAETFSVAKSRFLANASHELRTPLNGIIGFTQLLLDGADGGDEAERRDFLETIDDSARKLQTIVNDILELSKFDVGLASTQPLPCSLRDVVASVMSECAKLAQRKQLSLEVTGAAGTLRTLHTDPARLKQAICILVRNAIKFTERGTVRVDVRVDEVESRSWLIVTVADTGVGIPRDKFTTVFDLFMQADNSVTRGYGGLGLGLALTQRIAQSLGGTLAVESEFGRGSTFTLKLPATAEMDSTAITPSGAVSADIDHNIADLVPTTA